jgi:hypothetical protein
MDAGAAAMHEALIPRGYVHKASLEIRHFIFHPCNVVFRHDYCPPVRVQVGVDNLTKRPIEQVFTFRHESGAGGPMQFKRAVLALIAYEGHDRVLDYLEAMRTLVPHVAEETTLRFNKVVEGVQVYGY